MTHLYDDFGQPYEELPFATSLDSLGYRDSTGSTELHHHQKRHSRASDTSSAYSGSDKMLPSSVGAEDERSDPGEPFDNDTLKESLPDSDDEEGFDEKVGVSRSIYFNYLCMISASINCEEFLKTQYIC